MKEAAYVELPILGWLSGEPTSEASTGGLGWTYRDEAAMAAFDRPLEDPLVEKLLVDAIIRINSEVKTEAQAKLAVAALRKTMSHPDRLTANRQTLDLLRDGARVVLNPGQGHGLAVAGGEDKPGAFSFGRADCAENIGRRRPLVVRRGRPGSALRPSPSDLVLLPDAGFVLPPDFYRLAASLFCGRLFQEGGEVFLKAAAASSSWA